MDYMLLIFKDLKSCLSFSVFVIAQLDWAIQKKNWIIRSRGCVRMVVAGFSLRIFCAKVCGYSILWHQCKNFHCDTASKPDNDKHWNRVRYE
jgi:hypothetical protein